MNKFIVTAFTASALTGVAGCTDSTTVRPADAPDAGTIASAALSRSSLQFLGTGVLAQDRSAVVGTPQFLTLSEVFARDVYRIESSEPRYVSETLGGNPDPGSFAGGGGWAGFYTAIRAANSLILALPSAPATDLTTAEKNATSGFLKTIKGLEYLRLIELRDTVGIAIQGDDPDAITPIRCKAAVLTYIAALLDSANTELVAAGGTTKLPFVVPTGFTAFGRDYSLVSNIIRFNRGLKGKVSVEQAIDRKNPQPTLGNQAVTELTAALGGVAAGAVPSSTFLNGPYYKFVSSGSEATSNPRAGSAIGLNPLVKDSIQAGDSRASKIISRSTLSGGGVSTSITCSLCTSGTANQEAPLPILKDEELVLLRAQAYIEAGNFAAATLDVNSVRTFYGLAPHAVFTTKRQAIDAVLYEKRYSLLFEGPQRLVDLREYGRLNSTFLRAEVAGDPYNAAFPIPRAELNARQITANPACTA